MSDGRSKRVRRSHHLIVLIFRVPLLACPAVLFLAPHLAAQNQPTPRASQSAQPSTTQKYARPPKWPKEVVDTFFPDATAKLVGSRPDYGNPSPMSAAGQAPGVSPTAASNDGGWSKLIDPETMETEVKRLAQQLNKTVTAPAQFKGGGYKDCRREFTMLAALFAVIAEYDGDVRWKESAPQLRNEFARAGHNCKVGTDQTFQEAKQRKQDLSDLVGGTRQKSSTEADSKAEWAQVADRPPLMQRLKIAQQDRLTKWLASKQDFAAHRDDVKQEAQLLAMIADIISRPGFEYADDDTYVGYARDLKKSGGEVAAAVDAGNYDQARQALGNASKACASCHEGYRQ